MLINVVDNWGVYPLASSLLAARARLISHSHSHIADSTNSVSATSPVLCSLHMGYSPWERGTLSTIYNNLVYYCPSGCAFHSRGPLSEDPSMVHADRSEDGGPQE